MKPSETTNNNSKVEEVWMGAFPICLYQGFWCPPNLLQPTILFQTQFKAYDNDIILASLPKTGTTWLKSLIFAIVNRNKFLDFTQHPLQTQNAHELVLQLEAKVYNNITNGSTQPDFPKLPSPRLFATHIPYFSLPKSLKTSKTRIVYVCRNPLDTFVSSWHFYHQFKLNMKPELDHSMIEQHFGKFCEGKFLYGPYEDHVLGYSKESIQNPDKVLFMEYEGLIEDPKAHVKKLAEFVGYPFSMEEEKGNIIDEIIKLCSFDSLKEMEVNKSGNFYGYFENKALFRKGGTGDWTNYLTLSMVKKFDEIFQLKFKGSGFSFNHYQFFSGTPK
ncbi:cytosolic sulfotransferase 15-like [Spinacia oleracea]|uniref:Sulfotransferase n=1 Tax=Spinacia oleracea TaxID=3562 RepID=A0A9R0JMR0_SPIOL|nr:cytosolic sulfotransferase 15-like [Spinacia oleracea]